MIGRIAEKERLLKYAQSEESEFVAVYISAHRQLYALSLGVCQREQGERPAFLEWFGKEGEERHVRERRELFKSLTGAKKAVHLTYATTYGVRRNRHSGIVQSEVTLDSLFGP